MPQKTSKKPKILDQKDKEIIMILQKNGRESLTSISKKVNLSIDSINKRIKNMQESGIFEFGIFIHPRAIGYSLNADIKIKIHNYTEKQKTDFIAYLTQHKHVTTLLSVMGDYDFTCILVAKNTSQLEKLSTTIRQKFSTIIADWKGVLVLKTYKFEEYEL